MLPLSLTIGVYVQMAKASGHLSISKLSTILGSVHMDRITGFILMGKLTMNTVLYASRFRAMRSREASSRVVECKAFSCQFIYVDLIHPIVIQPHGYSLDYI